MSIKKLAKQLQEIEKQRRKILNGFMKDSLLIVGSVTHTKGRCGKANCACVEKPIHPITLLMTKENGKMRTRLIRKSDVKKIFALWQKYKNLKQSIGVLKEWNQREIELLFELIYCRAMDYKPL